MVNESAQSRSIKLHYKIVAYLAAWITALIATNPDGSAWAMIWMFPVGLFELVKWHFLNANGKLVMAVCVGIYVVHGFFYFRSRRFRSTVIWFAVLIVLLICNVTGCRQMLHAH